MSSFYVFVTYNDQSEIVAVAIFDVLGKTSLSEEAVENAQAIIGAPYLFGAKGRYWPTQGGHSQGVASTPAIPAFAVTGYEDIVLDPNEGYIGDAIEVNGEDFDPSTSSDLVYVDIYFSSQEADNGDHIDFDVTIYELVRMEQETDEDGEFVVSFGVPQSLTDGDRTANVRGGAYYVLVTYHDQSEIVAVARFEVLGKLGLPEARWATPEEISSVGYQWGPSSPIQAGIDCSGVIMWAYGRAYDPAGKYRDPANPVLMENVRGQWHDRERMDQRLSFMGNEAVTKLLAQYTTNPETLGLLPGDPIFFLNARPGIGERHVVMYIGAGNVIHASGYHGEVVCESLESALARFTSGGDWFRLVGLGRIKKAGL